MSQDDGEGQDELYAAFEALGGRLTWEEFARPLGSGRYPAALMQQVTILMGGDAAAAEQVVRDSFAALQQRGPVAEEEPRVLLYGEIMTRVWSVRWQGDAPQAEPGDLSTFPYLERDVFVLSEYAGLSVRQAAAAIGISPMAARIHLARAVSLLRR